VATRDVNWCVWSEKRPTFIFVEGWPSRPRIAAKAVSLKNVNSERAVPLHSALFAKGFLGFVPQLAWERSSQTAAQHVQEAWG